MDAYFHIPYYFLISYKKVGQFGQFGLFAYLLSKLMDFTAQTRIKGWAVWALFGLCGRIIE
jgi:hypothetical protein